MKLKRQIETFQESLGTLCDLQPVFLVEEYGEIVPDELEQGSRSSRGLRLLRAGEPRPEEARLKHPLEVSVNDADRSFQGSRYPAFGLGSPASLRGGPARES